MKKQGKKAPQAKRLRKTGGTTAPKGSNKTTAVGGNRGTIGVGPSFGVAGPGKFGPGPATALTGPGSAAGGPGGSPAGSPPPETPGRAREREEFQFGQEQAGEKAHDDIYQAALKYGDPAVIALYGEPQDPGYGAVPTIAREETKGKRENALAHNANNTFFSGNNLRDVNDISAQANRDRAAALAEFEAAKEEYDEIKAKLDAEAVWKPEEFDEGAQQEFNETEPTPQGGGGAGGNKGNKKKGQKNKMKNKKGKK